MTNQPSNPSQPTLKKIRGKTSKVETFQLHTSNLVANIQLRFISIFKYTGNESWQKGHKTGQNSERQVAVIEALKNQNMRVEKRSLNNPMSRPTPRTNHHTNIQAVKKTPPENDRDSRGHRSGWRSEIFATKTITGGTTH